MTFSHEDVPPCQWFSRLAVFLDRRSAPGLAVHCLTRQLFYRLRRGLHSVLAEDVDVHPATAIREITHKRAWPQIWSRIRETAGEPDWPERVPWKGWLVEGPATFRHLTIYVAMHVPPPDLTRAEPWTRERIQLVVRRVVWETIRGLRDYKILTLEYTLMS
jgi:hypothetical protein